MYLVYYVYAYLRKSDNTPYYIGKGKKQRAYKKYSGVNAPADKRRIVFLETNLSEVGALALERRYIKWYGRKDIGTGILRNLTDGGDGASGAVRTQSTKDKISASSTGRLHTAETKAKISASQKGIPNAPRSKETLAKMSATKKGKPSPKKGLPGKASTQKGIPRSEETKLKISESKRGKPGRTQTDETKNKIRETLLAKRKHPGGCFENGLNS